MRHTFKKIFSLALCAVMLCVLPAVAAEAETPARLCPVRVWGSVTRLESGSLYLKNSNESDPHNEIIVHLSEQTIVVDAVTGDPMEPTAIRDGDIVYAWVGPAMMLSLPPQSTAKIVVANIPADFGAPQYYEVSAADYFVTLGIPGQDGVSLTMTDGTELTVMDDTQLTPYLTRNIVTLENLVPGARILVWKDMGGAVSKVMVFAYAYRGYAALDGYGRLSVNGMLTSDAPRTIQGMVYLPLRTVAEYAGYDVRWDAELGAVVEYAGERVFSTRPDTDAVQTSDGNRGLSGPCLIDSGVTYLPARDLADLLDLFWS